MKWIGQHIWDFVSRFRNEIYLENQVTGSPSRFVSVDSTNKIVTSGKQATDTASGIVELATTAEATTGTDTTRVVTPAGLKAHVDSRWCFQNITFSFKVTSYAEHTWVSPHQHGPEYYLWGNHNVYKIGATQAASDNPVDVSKTDGDQTTLAIDYLDQGSSGFVIPKSCYYVGFYGNVRTNGTSPTSARPIIGIFRAVEPDDRNNVDIEATCIDFDKYDTSSGVNMKNRFLMLRSFDTPVELAAGNILIPAVGLDVDMDNSNGYFWGNFTIVLKTQIGS